MPALRSLIDAPEGLTEATLRSWVARAQDACPTLKVDGAGFVVFLERHLTAEAIAKPESLHVDGLFLAHRCLEGDRAALRLFDSQVLRPVVARVGKGDEELAQVLREKLLVGKKPRLLEYAGRGALAGWLTLVARRALADLRRAPAAREVGGEEASKALWKMVSSDPELSAVKKHARLDLELALNRALEALTEKDRALLRAHHLEGVSHTELGEKYGAPRSTVAHWLEQARERWLAEVKAELHQRLGIDSDSLDSLLGLVHSRLDLSLQGLKGD